MKKYSCKYCEKGFTRGDTLKRHQANACKVLKRNLGDTNKHKDVVIKNPQPVKKQRKDEQPMLLYKCSCVFTNRRLSKL